jgi:hypothetical protein
MTKTKNKLSPAKRFPNTKEGKIALLEDTLEYYKNNPRGIEEGKTFCTYLDETTGARCAVGRWMTKEKALNCQRDPVEEIFDRKYIPKWLEKMGLEFLEALQEFHDVEEHWKKKGKGNILLKRGQKRYEGIKKDILAEKL